MDTYNNITTEESTIAKTRGRWKQHFHRLFTTVSLEETNSILELKDLLVFRPLNSIKGNGVNYYN